jgi:hypothetical protein
MLKREKFFPPNRDEVFIWEFFISFRRDPGISGGII